MPTDSYKIRVCNTCGLRYPLVDRHAETFGIRCPVCLGETRVALSRTLQAEPKASTTPKPAPRFVSADAALSASVRGEKAVLLDNIRSAWNVGSIFRSADGFGFAHAYLCGITATPDGPSREAVQKTSLDAESSVPWSYHEDAVRLVKRLRKEGWRILALEEDVRAVAITSAVTVRRHSAPREVLIVGNEVTGVDPELLDLCDTIYCIPMHGQKRSFNVAIAFGVAAYALG